MNELNKPLITFALFAYNQEKYIAEAVNAALSQTYTPLQIILSDDASNDGTYEIMCELSSKYDGPHKVILNKNLTNLGIGSHVNKVMGMAEGEFVVAAAGDDISDSNRVELIADAFLSEKEVPYSIWSAARYIDATGSLITRKFPAHMGKITGKALVRNKTTLLGATHAWRREVFDFFGPLMKDVCFEDNAISFRSHLLGGVKYLDKRLVSYRTHPESLSNFTKMENASVLYAAAEKRTAWMLVAIAQRKRDLEFATSKLITPQRNHLLLSRELKKMEHITKRRLNSYQQFPNISFKVILTAFLDIEVSKVVVRSLMHHLTIH